MQISVLMSVYNETEPEIKESIESILKQTFTDFEFIIVNDNPERKDLPTLLNYFKQLDKRIIILNNEKNIGLALSLNKAANHAKAAIFARMDADDISELNRFKIQYDVIKKGTYDLVFSNYSHIDEKSSLISKESSCVKYSIEEIKRLLPFESIIHHPTVMMTRKIFETVGGYRDFPCAQDRDLWLRMWEKGASFYMIDEKLLKYRVRVNSVSALKKYQQKVTIDYIQDLFHQRLQKGTDNYSIENYNDYINGRGVNDTNKINEMHKYTKVLLKAQMFKRDKQYVTSTMLRIKVFLFSPIYRRSFIGKLRSKIYLRFYKISNKLLD